MSFSITNRRFTPGLVPTLAAAIVVAITVYLGHWQQGRAVEKAALQAEFDAHANRPALLLSGAAAGQDLRYRRATAIGSWHAAGEIFIDNKVNDGVAGFDVVTPVKLRDEPVYVLVNRGWIARGPAYPQPPVVPPLPQSANVTGVLVEPNARFIELSNDSVQGRVWQNLTVARYRTATGLQVLPFVLLAEQTEPPLKPVVEHPSAGVEKHKEYMLTWYSLAATIAILWIVLNLRPTSQNDGAGDHTATRNRK